MLYLKYRPQTIKEIDSIAVREKLSLLLSSGNLPHALLFTGPKGIGKTSSARIIAKAINCDNNFFAGKGESYEPCNTCSSCISISNGNSPDIIEMDAASNRKIDEIRSLIENIKFAPILARYKVYVIDEVHMLTTEAFNALLKTLEEPPKSTIFILATTELDKLPKTIISRCITIHFAKATEEEIVSMLKKVVKGEKKEIDTALLEFIASKADHAFRDATKLLEEAIAQNAFTIDSLSKMIGLTGENIHLLTILEGGNLAKTIDFIEQYDQKGGSIKVLIESTLAELHNQLITIAQTKKTGHFSIKEIALLIKLLQEAHSALKTSSIEVLPLEVSVIEYFTSIKK
jgi:DNA polymerase-3 subunit gamma/tau